MFSRSRIFHLSHQPSLPVMTVTACFHSYHSIRIPHGLNSLPPTLGPSFILSPTLPNLHRRYVSLTSLASDRPRPPTSSHHRGPLSFLFFMDGDILGFSHHFTKYQTMPHFKQCTTESNLFHKPTYINQQLFVPTPHQPGPSCVFFPLPCFIAKA